MSDEQTQQADDPSGPGWRDVEVGEVLQSDDMLSDGTSWSHTDAAGTPCTWQGVYHRRIEQPQQPSDSEPETMEDLRRRLAEFEVLLAEAERGGEQVNAELQQLREQLATLTQERDRLQSWLQQHHTTGQQSAVKKLERWLRPVLEVVAENPEDCGPLAVSILGYLPGIASRLIEE